MRKRMAVVFILSILWFLISSSAFGQPAKTPAKTGSPIKIGGSLAMTGLWGESTKWVKEGYDCWVDEINKKGGLLGRPVEMIYYDNESDADKAVTYYERAITVDKVDLVYGSTPGGANVAVMPLVEKYGKVFIGLGGHMKSFEQGFTYSFASPPLMGDWCYISLAGPIDDLIAKGDRPKTMAIFTMNNVSGISCRGPVVKSAEERGIKVVVDETYNLPLTDATPLVNKAKIKGADILVCNSAFDDGVMITRAAKAVRYNPKILWQQVGTLIPAWMKELGNDGNFVINNTFWHPKLPFSGNKEINEGAKTRLGIPEAPLFFGFGYCWMKTLELAVQGAGTLDQKKIRDYLRSNKFDLPYGKGITFDSRGLPPAYSYCTQTTNGRVELVWPKELATTKFVYPRPDWSK